MTHHPRHAAAMPPGSHYVGLFLACLLWIALAFVWAAASIGVGVWLAMTVIGPWL